MILAINSGNTHTLIGSVDKDGRAASVFQIPTDRSETEFGYAVKIREILTLQSINLADLRGAIVSCVVPPVTDILVRAVRLLIDVDALVVGAGIKTGLQLSINDPGTVASDIVAAAVAAKEGYPLPCVVVDMGTAIAMSVVNADGKYVGGSILPGAGLSLEALAREAALLPHVEITAPRTAIGVNTIDCMRSGIVYGTAGAIDGLLDRIAMELDEAPASIVATGNGCDAITCHCRHQIEIDQTLLLKGLRIIWDKNQRKRG